jgi:F-type H+-transporting ATPase subunit alpha
VNVGLSVSRVGGSAQIKAMKQVAGRLRLDLAQYRELAAFAQFGSDLDKATQQQLNRGAKTVEILKQDQYVPMPVDLQIISIVAATRGYLDDLPTEKIQAFEAELHKAMDESHGDLRKEIQEKGKIDDELEAKIKKVIEDIKAGFSA